MRRKIIIVFLLLAGIFLTSLLYTYATLPDVSQWKRENPQTTAFMRRYPGGTLQYYWISYSHISPYLKQAVVIAEDSNFFFHHGFDPQAIWKAAKRNWEEKEWKWGASTITQQLVKNLYLNPSKNPLRKIKEISIALALERTLSKQRILEMYLNVVEWGEGIYGAEAAARFYFNMPADILGPHQSATLAAILPSPRYFQHHLEEESLQRRAALILQRMGY